LRWKSPSGVEGLQAGAPGASGSSLGARPSAGWISLYEDADFTSTELWADLNDVAIEDPPQRRALLGLLAAANLRSDARAGIVQR
jgi:hypothetical protein